MRPPRVAIIGPTASGKSAVAMHVARAVAGSDRPVEIVSVDSMQVYRGMDIGTAKASAADRTEIRHHGLDLVDPSEDFTVADFQIAHRSALDEIELAGRRALLVGGTGL
ncbi:MAG: isopentenyl transferase family protein, partial [Actinomycetota bacterium]